MVKKARESGELEEPLREWLLNQGFHALEALGLDSLEPERIVIEPLAGDVSPRRYFRVRVAGHTPTHIAVYYPPALSASYSAFSRTTTWLEEAGVRVPRIVKLDENEQFALLEDLGDETLFDLPPGGDRASLLYRQAAAVAARIARLSVDRVGSLNPPLDQALLVRELEQTWRLFLRPRITDQLFAGVLKQAFDRLCLLLDRGPRAPCHRDFMSRNLVVLAGHQLAVIDHQDLRLGPALYDFASLLNDSLVLDAAQASALANEIVPTGSLLEYHRAAAQRSLKIIGTFHAFAERGSPRYLSMVPTTLRRAIDHLRQLPETEALVGTLESQLANSLPTEPSPAQARTSTAR